MYQSRPPSNKFEKVKVPHLVASSYSSSRETDEHEDLDDTAVGPTSTNEPNNAGAPPSTSWWYASGALVLIFCPFWSFDYKGGEIWVSLQAGLYLWVFFCQVTTLVLLKYLLDRVVNLSPMVVWYFCSVFLHAISSFMLMHACWITSVTIFHHAFQILHTICSMRVWITRYRGRSQWFYSSNVHCFKSKFLTYAQLQGEFFYILQSNSSILVFTLHMFILIENLTYIVISHQKGGDCKCI